MSIRDCENSGVPVFVALKEADPEVVEAVCEARRTLPQFLDAASKMQFSPAIYLVKVPFIDRSETGEQALARNSENAAENPTRPICHLWLTVTSVLDDLIFCSVHEAHDALHRRAHDKCLRAATTLIDEKISTSLITRSQNNFPHGNL